MTSRSATSEVAKAILVLFSFKKYLFSTIIYDIIPIMKKYQMLNNIEDRE